MGALDYYALFRHCRVQLLDGIIYDIGQTHDVVGLVIDHKDLLQLFHKLQTNVPILTHGFAVECLLYRNLDRIGAQ